MKRPVISCIIIILFALQACNSDEKDSAQTTTTVKDATIAVPLDRDDAQFAEQAANSNMAEIELGKLAMKMGADKRVKNFGAMLVKEHTKADQKLQMIAKSKKITLPATIDTAYQKLVSDLGSKQGDPFDHAYLNDLLKDHEANIKLFQNASKQLMDADLRAYASKNLLIYKRHLDAIDLIKGSMK